MRNSGWRPILILASIVLQFGLGIGSILSPIRADQSRQSSIAPPRRPRGLLARPSSIRSAHDAPPRANTEPGAAPGVHVLREPRAGTVDFGPRACEVPEGNGILPGSGKPEALSGTRLRPFCTLNVTPSRRSRFPLPCRDQASPGYGRVQFT